METRLLVQINFLGFACRPILLLICLFFLSANSGKHLLASTHGETAQVTNLKATFFVNTLKYVRWDNRDLPSAEIPIRLLIVGDDHTNFKSRLEYLLNVSDLEISGRSIKVESLPKWPRKDAEVISSGAFMAILLDSESKKWQPGMYPDIPGVLVVGEGESYLRGGLALCLIQDNNRVKMRVNLARAKSRNLEISSSLLVLNRVEVIKK